MPSTSTAQEARRARLAHGIALALVIATGCRSPGDAPPGGIAVAEVEAGGAAAKAGLKAGDALLRWEAADGSRHGRFESPFDVAEIEAEHGPRGPLHLHGRRAGAATTWTLAPGDWKLQPQAALPDAHRKTFERLLARSVKSEDVVAEGMALADVLRAETRAADAGWVLIRIGEDLAKAKNDAAASRAFAAARTVAERARDLLVEARAWEAEAWAAYRRNDFARAEAAYREALKRREALDAGGGSLVRALALARVGSVGYHRGDLDVAEDFWTRALEIREQLAPRSLQTATCLNGLGAVNNARGRLEAAEGPYRRALAIREEVAPKSPDVVQTLRNLGLIARRRGDLAGADALYRRALALAEEIAPGGSEVATTLNFLGVLARHRGDTEAAQTYLRRALEIHERASPGSARVAACLNNLGQLEEDAGRWREAEGLYRRALALYEQVMPGSVEVGATLANVGNALAGAGDRAGARTRLERSLELFRRHAPDSLMVAANLVLLATLAETENRLDRALALHEEALRIRRRLAARSAVEAESQYAIGRVLLRSGRRREAWDRWQAAIAALEAQRTRLAESEHDKTAFGLRYGRVFSDAVELLADSARTEEAFHLVERSRARSFVTMLGERDLRFAEADVPAALLGEQRDADAAYDQAQARLAKLQPGRDDAAIDTQLAALEHLRYRRTVAGHAIRAASPRLGALQAPVALNAADAARALDPGTLLLSFSVGRERTLVFALARGDDGAPQLEVVRGALGAEALSRRIAMLRGLVARGRQVGRVDAAFALQAGRLFDDLLGPLRARIDAARRLLILPDGPLHVLPFAALVDTRGQGRYLAEWKPLHVAASATVYAEIKKSPARAASGVPLVAFGDPVYDESPATWAAAHGAPPPALPASRAEVQALVDLHPGARHYLGAEATEERAKAVAPDARMLHFACHGVLDPRFPLDSGLALSAPSRETAGADNGLLQAWEVFERLHLDADLVTLSACDTGLGRDMGGEGLVGLVRAFQYAGARSVVASLWAVSDRSTRDRMVAFYRALGRGLTKDEALRAAQLEALRDPASAHPFHWAAFQLSGAWN